MTTIYGCNLAVLDNNACAQWLCWALQKGVPPEGSQGVGRVLAYASDGVAWGVIRSDQAIQWGGEVFPGKCPVPTEESLLETRFFGPGMEACLWRGESGWRGRLLSDAAGGDVPAEFAPASESRVLRADRVLEPAMGGFSRVGDNTGSEQVVPLACCEEDFMRRRWPLKLEIRSYFEQDPATGAVRIAAARLVDLVKEA